MNHARTILFLASLAVSAGLNAGAANATDHRMWREQVTPPLIPLSSSNQFQPIRRQRLAMIHFFGASKS